MGQKTNENYVYIGFSGVLKQLKNYTIRKRGVE